MFSEKSFEERARCSFCFCFFNDIVKLIPECNSSVCHACYDELKKEVTEDNEFICQKCNDLHRLPSSGLADNTALLNILRLESVNETPDQFSELFSFKLNEYRARMGKLKEFDLEKEITAHCDKLWEDVSAAIDQAFDHLNKLGNQLVTQINEYRDSVLVKLRDPRTNRFQSWEASSLHPEIVSLTSELEKLGSTPITKSGESVQPGGNCDFRAALNELKRFQAAIAKTEIKFKAEMFNGKIMRFKPNPSFEKASMHLGTMTFHVPDRKVAEEPKEDPASEAPRAPSSAQVNLLNNVLEVQHPPDVLHGHSGPVNQVLFLPNGELASCSDDKHIKIWDHRSKEILYGLTESKKRVNVLTFLQPRYLISGSDDNSLYVWDLCSRSLVTRRQGHGKGVFSVKTLPNDRIISASLDGSLKAWRLDGKDLIPMACIKGHGAKDDCEIGVLSSEELIICSQQINVWRLGTPKPVKTLPNDIGNACAVQVLNLSQGVAIAFTNGLIKILASLDSPNFLSLNAYDTHGLEGRICMACLPRGSLMTAGPSAEPTIKIWNPQTGKLLKSICFGLLSINTISMSMAADERTLAAASRTNTITIFPIKAGSFEP